jgi:tartrate-resistant acid phosphatase type 5
MEGIADFFLVDTSPFIQKYWNNSKYDWRQVAPLTTYVENLVQVSRHFFSEPIRVST